MKGSYIEFRDDEDDDLLRLLKHEYFNPVIYTEVKRRSGRACFLIVKTRCRRKESLQLMHRMPMRDLSRD